MTNWAFKGMWDIIMFLWSRWKGNSWTWDDSGDYRKYQHDLGEK